MGVIRYNWRQADNHRARRRAIKSIILHSTEGHRGGDIPTLVHGDGRKVSVHWYVESDGSYVHFVQDSDCAFHAGEVKDPKYSNDASIGIEQEHIDGKEPWPDVQIQATANLCAFLIQKHGDLEITSHKAVAIPPGRKSDPEPYPWSKFNVLLLQARKETWSAEQI